MRYSQRLSICVEKAKIMPPSRCNQGGSYLLRTKPIFRSARVGPELADTGCAFSYAFLVGRGLPALSGRVYKNRSHRFDNFPHRT